MTDPCEDLIDGPSTDPQQRLREPDKPSAQTLFTSFTYWHDVSSSRRSWMKYSEWYQSTIWLVMQPGIITPRSFVWSEENWFADWAWSCLGSLSLMPFVLLSWRRLIFSNIIDLTALTPFDKNWTELWHSTYNYSTYYSKYNLLVTLWFKKFVNVYTLVHLFIVFILKYLVIL